MAQFEGLGNQREWGHGGLLNTSVPFPESIKAQQSQLRPADRIWKQELCYSDRGTDSLKSNKAIHLSDVQAVYSGPEGDLWELLMGEQIHVGGLQSSADLAERARIPENSAGVDLCAATGAGMRFLIRFRGVRSMTGVDATPAMVEKGKERAAEEDLAEQISFRVADVCDTGLPEGEFDFVWGEDAWCYVEDKQALIAEAARLVKAGGVVAFTDWVEGPVPLSDGEAHRSLTFMKFPSLCSVEDYRSLLDKAGLKVETAEDTGRFAPAMELYIAMFENQLTYDGLKILGFDTEFLGAVAGEMEFIRTLAHDGKIAQGVFVARKS